MGCVQSKKHKHLSIIVSGPRRTSKESTDNLRANNENLSLFTIREESANNEESAVPSRVQSCHPTFK